MKDCYTAMGANYDDVMRRLASEERVKKFLGKFLEDQSFPLLCSAMSDGRIEEAFRAAHSLKGVCLNLGLTRLQVSSSELTENLRDGKTDGNTPALLQRVEADYQTTAAALHTLFGL